MMPSYKYIAQIPPNRKAHPENKIGPNARFAAIPQPDADSYGTVSRWYRNHIKQRRKHHEKLEELGKGGGGAAQMVKRGPALLPKHLNVAQRKAAEAHPGCLEKGLLGGEVCGGSGQPPGPGAALQQGLLFRPEDPMKKGRAGQGFFHARNAAQVGADAYDHTRLLPICLIGGGRAAAFVPLYHAGAAIANAGPETGESEKIVKRCGITTVLHFRHINAVAGRRNFVYNKSKFQRALQGGAERRCPAGRQAHGGPCRAQKEALHNGGQNCDFFHLRR